MPQVKRFLVVGGTSGIGRRIVDRLSADGAEVFTVSRRATPETNADRHLSLDVTGDDMAALKAFLPEALDGVVYGPGSITLKSFRALKPDDLRGDYEINVLGAVKVLQTALPALKKRPGAGVVLFSTVATAAGMGFHASIAAAKAAVEGLGLSLAAEWARDGIRVNVVAPSLTATPLAEALLSTEAKQEAAAARHPLARVGTPVEIAAAACYLLADDAGWVTGQVLRVDGGLSSLRPL